MTDVGTERETIESLLATSEVYITVTMETANAHGVPAQRWHCHFTRYNALERWYRCTTRCTTKSSCSRGRRS